MFMISRSAGMHVMLAGAQAAVRLCVTSWPPWRPGGVSSRGCAVAGGSLVVRFSCGCVLRHFVCGGFVLGVLGFGGSPGYALGRVAVICALLVERAKPCKAACRCSCKVADKLRLDLNDDSVICKALCRCSCKTCDELRLYLLM